MSDYRFWVYVGEAGVSFELWLERLLYRLAYWLHARYPERRHR